MKRTGLKRGAGMRRTPIKKFGRISKERADRRAQWIADHPPLEGWNRYNAHHFQYYNCHICVYFNEHKSVARVLFENFVLEHIVPKGQLTLEESQEDSNLGPAHVLCNNVKGSQLLEQMEVSPMTNKSNPHI